MSTSSNITRKRRSDTIVVARNMTNNNIVDAIKLSGANNVNESNNEDIIADNLQKTTVQVVVKLKIRMKRFHGVAAWSWNANDDVCGICQSAFEGTAPGVKYPGEDCPVVWGKCGHAYHLQCVSKWLSQPASKNSCPICRQEWEFGQNPVNTDGNSD